MRGGPRAKGVRGLFPVSPGLPAVENCNYVAREVRNGEYVSLFCFGKS